ncbi:hypothetical protein NUW54_g5078 [Trametes sanguinea]|uniref:Uncharacterized protein n=1 Tax=Trametes sanguinea TaxID=158606 RepID=A0ACC1PXE1_9APHY|nr:hypothetical protein NUW54_g5078 [Trametes sanguinea]
MSANLTSRLRNTCSDGEWRWYGYLKCTECPTLKPYGTETTEAFNMATAARRIITARPQQQSVPRGLFKPLLLQPSAQWAPLRSKVRHTKKHDREPAVMLSAIRPPLATLPPLHSVVMFLHNFHMVRHPRGVAHMRRPPRANEPERDLHSIGALRISRQKVPHFNARDIVRRNSTDADSGINTLSDCAWECMDSASEESGCISSDDITCFCKDPVAQDVAFTCIESQCFPREVTRFEDAMGKCGMEQSGTGARNPAQASTHLSPLGPGPVTVPGTSTISSQSIPSPTFSSSSSSPSDIVSGSGPSGRPTSQPPSQTSSVLVPLCSLRSSVKALLRTGKRSSRVSRALRLQTCSFQCAEGDSAEDVHPIAIIAFINFALLFLYTATLVVVPARWLFCSRHPCTDMAGKDDVHARASRPRKMTEKGKLFAESLVTSPRKTNKGNNKPKGGADAPSKKQSQPKKASEASQGE